MWKEPNKTFNNENYKIWETQWRIKHPLDKVE